MSQSHTASEPRVPCRCEACDAARYRWLRAQGGGNRLPHITQYPPASFDGDKYYAVQISKHGLDSAIDAAAIMHPLSDDRETLGNKV